MKTVEELIEDKNYLGAYSSLKSLDEDEEKVMAGLLVSALIKDLDKARKEKRVEELHVLRSLILWIFRDYPGLSGIYRLQLRGENKADLFKIFEDLGEFAKKAASGVDMENTVEDVVENVKQKAQDLNEDIQSGEAGKKVEDFMQKASETVQEGIRHVDEVFKTMSKPKD
jgi:hypothetical protein